MAAIWRSSSAVGDRATPSDLAFDGFDAAIGELDEPTDLRLRHFELDQIAARDSAVSN